MVSWYGYRTLRTLLPHQDPATLSQYRSQHRGRRWLLRSWTSLLGCWEDPCRLCGGSTYWCGPSPFCSEWLGGAPLASPISHKIPHPRHRVPSKITRFSLLFIYQFSCYSSYNYVFYFYLFSILVYLKSN
jgi:hypothetical protein